MPQTPGNRDACVYLTQAESCILLITQQRKNKRIIWTVSLKNSPSLRKGIRLNEGVHKNVNSQAFMLCPSQGSSSERTEMNKGSSSSSSSSSSMLPGTTRSKPMPCQKQQSRRYVALLFFIRQAITRSRRHFYRFYISSRLGGNQGVYTFMYCFAIQLTLAGVKCQGLFVFGTMFPLLLLLF